MSSKAAILAELALSRAAMKQSGQSLREELDYAAKMRRSVRSSPLLWLGGATAIGYILAGPKTRVKTVYRKVSGKGKPQEKETGGKTVKDLGFLGMIAALFRFAYPLVRPALHAFLAKRATEWLAKAG